MLSKSSMVLDDDKIRSHLTYGAESYSAQPYALLSGGCKRKPEHASACLHWVLVPTAPYVPASKIANGNMKTCDSPRVPQKDAF